MIFVTVGTHHQGFPRLLHGLEGLSRVSEVVVQHGPGAPPAGVADAIPYMSFEAILDHFDRADAVVTHAGVGSVLCARRAGHTPIVVPRLHALGEHVDDHQAELTDALAEEGLVVPAWDVAELDELLRTAPPRQRPDVGKATSGLHAAVRQALLGQ